MNKLMFAAAGVAVVGSTFAAPQVFDYKASVKHMYLKQVKVTVAKEGTFSVYQKYQKSASLKGYLIMDDDGILSEKVSEGPVKNADDGLTSYDYGRNRGFLVVLNSSAEKAFRAPKILPAVLDAKWLDTAFTKAHAATSGLAEGTLFLGGDSIKCTRPQLDTYNDGNRIARDAAPALPDDTNAGMTAYADYVWTSVYLFGQYNGPNWFPDIAGNCPFDEFEAAWDGNLPQGVQIDWVARTAEDAEPRLINYYHDTWMNGAGIGKYYKVNDSSTTTPQCCGIPSTTYEAGELKLDTLSGNLKGGLFLCTENGILANGKYYQWWDALAWEDQFVSSRDIDAAEGLTFDDSWQNDLWQDGAVEQETTDVIYGTWSIKWNRTFFDAKKGIAKDCPAYPGYLKTSGALNDAIYGAAIKLMPKVNYYNGSEIFDYTSASRTDIPMLTPKFLKYYGLVTDAE